MAEKIHILIADEMPKVRERMRSVLSHESRIRVVGECSDGESAIKMAKKLKPDIVLIDINMSGPDDTSPTEILTATIPNVLVIVTFDQGAKKNLKKAMAEGAREYIVKPFTEESLMDTIVNLYDKDQKRRMILDSKRMEEKIETKPQIITIFGTKGGVGKSTVATNIATSLAKKTNEKVVILDLDLEFGDVSVMMNIYPKRTIVDLINEIQNLEGQVLDEYLTEHPSGVKILPAPLSPEHREYITASNIEKILKVLLEDYKYIVIDMAPSFEGINLAALDMADKILFVTTLDLPTIKNVKAGLHVMKSLKYDECKISLILNRYHRQFGISPKDLEKTTGKKILKIIPEDNITVIQAVNQGKPFVLEHSNRAVVQSIKEIADFIIGSKEEKKTLLKKPLLRRLLRG